MSLTNSNTQTIAVNTTRQPLSTVDFSRWTSTNMYRTSSNDMSKKVITYDLKIFVGLSQIEISDHSRLCGLQALNCRKQPINW